MTRSSVLAAVVGALIAAGGCARAAQPVASPQPFRDEHDPGDGFQFHEGAVPAEDDKSSADEVTTETTIEIDVDEDSADSTSTDEAADAGDDESASDDGASDDEESGDDSSGSGLTTR